MDARCDTAIRALLDARWADWPGLPTDCTLAALEKRLGGSTQLDAEAALGTDAIACTRSSLNDAPLVAWHDAGGRVRLVELDLESDPRPLPGFGGGHRLDVPWGTTMLQGGERVWPERGLALVVAGGHVVAALGFAPTNFDDWAATLRPHRAAAVPMPRPKRRPTR